MVVRIGRLALICSLLLSLVMVNEASAVSITGYDVLNAREPGYGGWSHYYTGTISPNTPWVNYSGGSGTMNNGIVETSYNATQLFYVTDLSSITLYLDGTYNISEIEIYGGDMGETNSIPGKLSGWTVEIGGTFSTYTSTQFGAECQGGILCDDFVTLDQDQQSLATNVLSLSRFTSADTYFSIAEIKINGKSANEPVPEPATLLLLGSGLLGLGLLRKKYRR